MKKLFFLIFFTCYFCNTSFSQAYYFKGCQLSNAVFGDYIIDFNKNLIEVNLKSIDGNVQNFKDKIKSVEKNQIVSEKIKSGKGEKIYYQYFLNADTKTVIKLQFKKESGIDMDIYKLNQKRESTCTDVKSDWDERKIEKAKTTKEQKQILKAQEKIKNEQNALINCQSDNYKQWTNCKGTYKSENNYKYSGLFINGKITKGTAVYPGGAKYIGEFKEFKPHGYGTFVWTNGDKYFGEWLNGKSHGNGTKVWKDGRKYLGNFKNDKLHGQGTLFYPDGKKYVGGFVNGKRHGEGTFSYSDGTAYIGQFIAGKEEGVGECVAEDGTSKSCQSKLEVKVKDFSGKDTRNISIVAKRWIRISHYETQSGKGKKIIDKLKSDFEIKASEVCVSKGNYNVLDRKIEVLDIDETPAYGLETKLKIGINGVVECI